MAEIDISQVSEVIQEISALPGDLMNLTNPVNIRKSQPMARYWRPLQSGEWAQTTPLPADPLSILHYMGKGFKGRAPQAKVDFKCSESGCEFQSTSSFGLQAHQRKHRKEV